MLFIATYSFLREIILDNKFISSFKIHKDTDSVEKRNFLLPIHSTILLFGKQVEIYNNFPGKNQMWHSEEAKVVAEVYMTTMVLFLIGQRLSSEK